MKISTDALRNSAWKLVASRLAIALLSVLSTTVAITFPEYFRAFCTVN